MTLADLRNEIYWKTLGISWTIWDLYSYWHRDHNTATHTPSHWHWTSDIVARDTVPVLLKAARQHSAGFLLHTIVFVSKSGVCVLIDWCGASALAARGSKRALLGFSASRVKAWLCLTRMQICLSQEVQRMERQKNQWPLPMVRTSYSLQKEIGVGVDFAPKWTC